jgi:hypothetical protein
MGRMKETLGGDLFGYVPPPRAHARSGDPITSHEAAARHTSESLTQKQQLVLSYFRALRQMTDVDLRNRLRADLVIPANRDGSTYRTRRSELVDLGKLRDSGQKRFQEGSNRIIWEIIPLGES